MRLSHRCDARVILVGILLVIAHAGPARSQTVTDNRVWTALALQGRIATESPWRWSTDVLFRMRDGASTRDFIAGRVIIGRDLTRRSSAGLGYAYGAGFLNGGGTFDEHRFVQQYVWSAPVTVGALSLRSRLEERLIEGNSGVQLRARQQVRLSRDLVATGRLQVVLSEEAFVNANSTSRAARGFESNRVFAGVRQMMTARTGVEVGYLNLYARSRSAPSRRSHVLSVAIVASY
jgi:hypothetical protein